MSTPGDDKDLEAYLHRDSDMSRRYQATAIEEPPAELDSAVLAKARAAVASSSSKFSRLPVRRRARWIVPFSLAATVLLSFAIFREAGMETGVVMQDFGAPAPVPATVPAAAEREQSAAVVSSEVASTAVAVAPGTAGNATPATGPSAQTRADVPQKSIESRQAVTVAEAVQPAVASSSAVLVAEVSADAAAVAPASETEQASRAPVSAAAPTTVASGALRAAPPAAQPASVGLARGEAADEPLRTPEAWLEDVRKLRTGGQQAEADAELQRFLEAYPGYFDRNPGVARP